MCGIVGGLSVQPLDPERLAAAVRSLGHRGPDGDGTHVALDGRAVLGHTRLAIVDLAGGQQPLSDAAGQRWLVFNGEIYNHQALRPALADRGCQLRTASDAEVALHVERPADLDGMFAYAILDESARTLTLVRDRLGIKPLYYLVDEGRLLFASEPKAILALAGERPEADRDALRAYLRWKYVPAPLSAFAGVAKLPPGCALTAHLDGDRLTHTVEPWWDVPLTGELRDEAEALEALDARLSHAVASHLMADVEVGALLSGGVDSSLVVALAAKAGATGLKTFTVGWREEGFDPLPQAAQLAAHCGTEHHGSYIELDDALADLATLARHFDEPFGDSSAIACWKVSQVTRAHVKVALTGDGGDESFGGYKLSEQALIDVDSPLRPLHAAAFKAASTAFSPEAKFLRTYRPMGVPVAARHAARRELISPWLREQLLGPGHDDRDPFETTLARGRDRWSIPMAARYADLKCLLPGDMLTKVDRTSMACGLECRVPILDHHVTELAARLHPDLLVKQGVRKYLLKKLAERYVPHDLLYRKKKGFRIPIKRWFKQGLLDQAAPQLTDGVAVSRGLLQREGIDWVLRAQRRKWMNLSSLLWSLLALEHWARAYLD